MKKVLFEKYKYSKFFESTINVIKEKSDCEILFLTKDILIYKNNYKYKIHPFHRKPYTIDSSKIVGLCIYDIPDCLMTDLRFKIDCIRLKSSISNSVPISKNFTINTFSSDKLLGVFQPVAFFEKHEQDVINFIFFYNSILKNTFYKIDLLKNPALSDVKNIFKSFSNSYKIYKKIFNTNLILEERKKLAKESRLSSKKLSHSRVNSD